MINVNELNVTAEAREALRALQKIYLSKFPANEADKLISELSEKNTWVIIQTLRIETLLRRKNELQ